MQHSRKQDNPIPLTFATYRKDRKNNINKKHHLNAMYVSTLKLQPGICLKTVFALLLAASASACHCRNARTHPDKQRLIVTTDLGGTDPDDTQSMIHLLVCSNAIDIEGLVSSQVWSDMPDKVDRIREVVGQFEKVLPR